VINLRILKLFSLLNNQVKWKLLEKDLKNIKLLFLDVDGVLTDGGIYISPEGQILKKFDVRDGLGLKLLKDNNVEIAFISGGASGSTEIRARQLGIKFYYVEVKNKYNVVKDLQEKLKISKLNTAYVGDDINDIVVRPLVKFLFTPSDGSKLLKKISDAYLNNKGGFRVVRELSEKIINAKGQLNSYSLKGWIEKND
tara:strand:+ start:316 stop:906 length:591 start_codon:yes stop_codon:yes gene_type:complete